MMLMHVRLPTLNLFVWPGRPLDVLRVLAPPHLRYNDQDIYDPSDRIPCHFTTQCRPQTSSRHYCYYIF